MNKRIFPIKQDPACLLKWSWSTVFLNSGTSASCHRTQKYVIDPDNFDQFHNAPEKLTARQKMLDGQWPGAGCEYCKKIEDAGQTSDRQFQLEQQQDPGLTPPELFKNNQALSVTPTILEVYFSNTCNMACVYCGPQHSSLWEDENRKHGNLFKNADQFAVEKSQKNPHYDKMSAELWSYLATDKRYLTLRRFHILGGEPFLIKELDDALDFWETHGNPNLVFSIITNLNIPTKKIQQYLDRFERLATQDKIWKFQITASLDGWGPEEEYVRYGLNLATWEQNLKLLLAKPWISVSINSALSALSIKQLPGLIGKIHEWDSLRPVNSEAITFSFEYTGFPTTPLIFGAGVFEDDFAQALGLLDKTVDAQRNTHQMLESISNTISSSTRKVDKIEQLKDYLNQLDQRRNTNWRITFPWLDRSFE